MLQIVPYIGQEKGKVTRSRKLRRKQKIMEKPKALTEKSKTHSWQGSAFSWKERGTIASGCTTCAVQYSTSSPYCSDLIAGLSAYH
jgi:hypothetical protein